MPTKIKKISFMSTVSKKYVVVSTFSAWSTIFLWTNSVCNTYLYKLKMLTAVSELSVHFCFILFITNLIVAAFSVFIIVEWAFHKVCFSKAYDNMYDVILPFIIFHIIAHDFIQDYVDSIGEGPSWVWVLIGLDGLLIVTFISLWSYYATRKSFIIIPFIKEINLLLISAITYLLSNLFIDIYIFGLTVESFWVWLFIGLEFISIVTFMVLWTYWVIELYITQINKGFKFYKKYTYYMSKKYIRKIKRWLKAIK